jgi:hypothetical protein
MGDPASFTDEENWHGSHYELAFELGLRHAPDADTTLRRALAAVWREPRLDGCYLEHLMEPEDQPRVDPVIRDIDEPGHLHGRATLPTGVRIVCGTVVVRHSGEDGVDWLCFYLPSGALGAADERVGAFPFHGPGTPSSASWRAPVDDWLAGIATRVWATVRFRVALIGEEASAPGDPWDGHVPEERGIAHVVPTGDGVVHLPPTRWDWDGT